MDLSNRVATRGFKLAKWLWVPALALTTACDSSLIREAEQAEGEGRTINNEVMLGMYPQSFRPGQPPYLERDFEAGAEFICDDIKIKYKRDICSEPQIHWR
jgi:hypothetical protein